MNKSMSNRIPIYSNYLLEMFRTLSGALEYPTVCPYLRHVTCRKLQEEVDFEEYSFLITAFPKILL